jgi:hypothetical protein
MMYEDTSPEDIQDIPPPSERSSTLDACDDDAYVGGGRLSVLVQAATETARQGFRLVLFISCFK